MEACETRTVNMVDVCNSISSAYLDCWRGESDQRWTLVYTSHSWHKRSVTYQFCVNSAEDIFWCLLKQGMRATFDKGSVLIMVSFHGIATPKGWSSCNFDYPWLGNVPLHGAEWDTFFDFLVTVSKSAVALRIKWQQYLHKTTDPWDGAEVWQWCDPFWLFGNHENYGILDIWSFGGLI